MGTQGQRDLPDPNSFDEHIGEDEEVGLSIIRFRVWPWQRLYRRLRGLIM